MPDRQIVRTLDQGELRVDVDIADHIPDASDGFSQFTDWPAVAIHDVHDQVSDVSNPADNLANLPDKLTQLIQPFAGWVGNAQQGFGAHGAGGACVVRQQQVGAQCGGLEAECSRRLPGRLHTRCDVHRVCRDIARIRFQQVAAVGHRVDRLGRWRRGVIDRGGGMVTTAAACQQEQPPENTAPPTRLGACMGPCVFADHHVPSMAHVGSAAMCR